MQVQLSWLWAASIAVCAGVVCAGVVCAGVVFDAGQETRPLGSERGGAFLQEGTGALGVLTGGAVEVALLRGVGCEGAVVGKGVGMGLGAFSDRGGVVIGEGFFDDKWSEADRCAVYAHEKAHIELGHTELFVDSESTVQRELSADWAASLALLNAGGSGCELYAVLTRLVAQGQALEGEGYPLMSQRLGQLDEGFGCSGTLQEKGAD